MTPNSQAYLLYSLQTSKQRRLPALSFCSENTKYCRSEHYVENIKVVCSLFSFPFVFSDEISCFYSIISTSTILSLKVSECLAVWKTLRSRTMKSDKKVFYYLPPLAASFFPPSFYLMQLNRLTRSFQVMA